MKSLSNISVCRILLAIIFSLYISIKIVPIILIFLLLAYSYKECLIYLALLFLVVGLNGITIDYIPYGIVEKNVNNYYIIDKFLYKTKTYEEVQIGDVVKCNSYFINEELNDLKKNIKFTESDIVVLSNFKLKKSIYERINSFSGNTKTALDKFIYNINNYDDLSFNIGYGLAIYYLLKTVYRKNRSICLVIIIIYSTLFYFDVKLYLILFAFLVNLLKIDKIKGLTLKILLLLLINKCLLYNYSILVPILIESYTCLDIKIDHRTYFALIQSFLFGSINVVSTFLYKFYIRCQIALVLLSLLLIFIPSFEYIYSILLCLYSRFNNISLEIRGSFSLLSLITLELIIKCFRIQNETIIYVLVLILLLLPLNNPFFHISFIDVGQGDSILIQMPFKSCNILIDTGSKYNYYKLSKYLYKKGIYTIDYLIITHNDSDHNGNIDSLQKDFKLLNIINSGQNIEQEGILLKYLDIGEFDNDNDNSLVYYANINGIKFLFTGDISEIAERKLIKQYCKIDIDILKVSHHGSKTGTSKYLVSSILPDFSIISTSGQYNHPSKNTLVTLNSFKSKIYTTKEYGNIEIYITRLGNILKTSRWDFVIISS